jgi:hypothetical protein
LASAGVSNSAATAKQESTIFVEFIFSLIRRFVTVELALISIRARARQCRKTDRKYRRYMDLTRAGAGTTDDDSMTRRQNMWRYATLGITSYRRQFFLLFSRESVASRKGDRIRADIHDGPEHKPLQAEAGYIDARPQRRQIDEILLRRTAGPYKWVNFCRRASCLVAPGAPE